MADALFITSVTLNVCFLLVIGLALGASYFLSAGVRQLVQNLEHVYNAGKGSVHSSHPLRPCVCTPADVHLAIEAISIGEALINATQNTSPSFFNSKGHPGSHGWQVLDAPSLPFFAAAREVPATANGKKRLLMVVFRGTATSQELERNDLGTPYLLEHTSRGISHLIHAGLPMPYPPQVSWPGGKKDAPNTVPKVSAAFFDTFRGPLQEAVIGWLDSRLAKGEVAEIVVSGHSLGAAVACLCAAHCLDRYPTVPLSLLTAATPKPGNAAFRALLEPAHCVAFANEADPIPWLPTSVVPDLTQSAADAVFEYVVPPGLCVFSMPCTDLLTAHEAATYRKGVALFRAGASPPAQAPVWEEQRARFP